MHQHNWKNINSKNQHEQKIPQTYRNNIFKHSCRKRLPPQLKQQLKSVNENVQIIQFENDDQAFVKIFYISLLNINFSNKQFFDQCLQKLFEILDDDKFTFVIQQEQQSIQISNWSTSKMKRMISFIFTDLYNGDYVNVLEFLQSSQTYNKILLILFLSILAQSQKIGSYQELISFQVIKQEFGGYFQIQFQNTKNLVRFSKCNTFFHIQSDYKILFFVQVQKQQNDLDGCFNFTESIQLNNMVYSQHIEPLDLNFNLSQFSEDQSSNTQKQYQNHDQNKNNFFMSEECLKNQKIQNFCRSRLSSRACNSPFYIKRTQKQEINQIKRNLYQNGSMQNNCSQSKPQLNKLILLATKRTKTQQSIYQDQIDYNFIDDQQSFLDQSISTLKRISDKKITDDRRKSKEYIQTKQSDNFMQSKGFSVIRPYSQNYDTVQNSQQNQSLINKLYKLSRMNKNKSQNSHNRYFHQQNMQAKSNEQSKLNKLNQQSKLNKQNQNNKIIKNIQNIKPIIQMENKPDFKKVKPRRRKSQDDLGTFKQQKAQNKGKKAKLGQKQIKQNQLKSKTNQKKQQNRQKEQKIMFKQWNQNSQKEGKNTLKQFSYGKNNKAFILLQPKQMNKNENIYSKYGYINMNISQQFTDSLILKQLAQKYTSKIKSIKQKARYQRQTLRQKITQI